MTPVSCSPSGRRWKIAVRTPNDPEREIRCTCDLHRVLHLDESACMDRNEQKRVASDYDLRYTEAENIQFEQRRVGKEKKGAKHETVVTGFNLAGSCCATHEQPTRCMY